MPSFEDKSRVEEVLNNVWDDTNSFLKTSLKDSSGNTIGSHLSADGDYHLGVQIEQNVVADTNNSSTTNLTSANSYAFTGTATSTLGVVGLQWSLKTDQNAYIYIDQSPDGTNWDLTDTFQYYYSLGGSGGTVQALNSYWRIRVVLMGTTDTTYFRLQGVLCPIAEPLPRSLDGNGRLKTSCSGYDPESDIQGKITPFGRLKTATAVRIIGTSFSGTTKDTNFWSEAVTGTGSVTQAGEVTLATGTTADSTAKYASVRRARHVAGTANEFKFTGRLITDPQTNNLRRCGVYDGTSGVDGDGFFFQVNGTTFGVGVRKGGTDTIVNSGSFNGNWGSSMTMSTTMGNFVIWYWERVAYFFVNGRLLHKISATTASLTNTITLPVTMENNNTGGNTTNNSFEILVASVVRFGELQTNPQYYHLSGNAATHILKYGAGVLQKIVFNNTSGTSITIYDNTAGSGTVIGIITTTATAIGAWEYNVPFSNGLTLVTVGNSLDATIVYE